LLPPLGKCGRRPAALVRPDPFHRNALAADVVSGRLTAGQLGEDAASDH
jgi:hypothetical protein